MLPVRNTMTRELGDQLFNSEEMTNDMPCGTNSR